MTHGTGSSLFFSSIGVALVLLTGCTGDLYLAGSDESNQLVSYMNVWNCNTANDQCVRSRPAPNDTQAWTCRWTVAEYFCLGSSGSSSPEWHCEKVKKGPFKGQVKCTYELVLPAGQGDWLCTVNNQAQTISCLQDTIPYLPKFLPCDKDDAEICFNGEDDDCDGFSDFEDEECQQCQDVENCENGRDDDCDGKTDLADEDCLCTPAPEECDSGLDEDCDGDIDQADNDCQCQPVPEVCGNGLDDDCDGAIDGNDTDCQPCTPSTTQSCLTGLSGVCNNGTQTCALAGGQYQWDTCQATIVPGSEVELCGNNLDDDCDGKSDAQDADCQSCTPNAKQSCVSGKPGVCASGTQTCVLQNGVYAWGTCQATTQPGATKEICGNGLDDDCDGKVDAKDTDCQECTLGKTRSCASGLSGVCSSGTQTCIQDQGRYVWNPCKATIQPKTQTENCNNGLDDDCDGAVDEDGCACTEIKEVDCHAMSTDPIPNCNAYPGYNEAGCYQEPGKCSPRVLEAWCTRRMGEGASTLWFKIHQEWVDQMCSGPVNLVGADSNIYQCFEGPKCTIYKCVTPLVLVFSLDGAVEYLPDNGHGAFDLSAGQDGSGQRTDWPTAKTPWLAIDLDGDGQISSGRELFGSATLLGGTPARHGFEALTALDESGDGTISAQDHAYAQLRLWSDENGNRISEPGELRSLKEAGIISLSLSYQDSPRCTGRGNCERQRATFQWQDQHGTVHTGAVVDVHLAVHQH